MGDSMGLNRIQLGNLARTLTTEREVKIEIVVILKKLESLEYFTKQGNIYQVGNNRTLYTVYINRTYVR